MVIKKPSGRKDVHLRFKDHAPESRYLLKPIGAKTRSFVQERKRVGDPIGTSTLPSDKVTNRYAQSMRREFERFVTGGGKIYTGETYYTRTEKHRLVTLKKKRLKATKAMFGFPELGRIQEYFQAIAEEENYRHELIRRTIHRLVKEGKTPLEIQYAQPHDLMIEELRNEGIKVSSEKDYTGTWIDTEITSRILRGNKLQPVDYKRGYVCMLDYYNKGMLKTITGKEKHSEMTNSGYEFYKKLQRVLMDKLSERQLDQIINAKNPRLLFTLNGLPEKPSRAALKRWLEAQQKRGKK